MLLEEFVKPLGLSQTELANHLGISRVRLSEILRQKRGITPDTALRLERVFGMGADFWLNLQMKWDLWHARQNAKDLHKLKPLVTI
jgi:antitoxin HigA-1